MPTPRKTARPATNRTAASSRAALAAVEDDTDADRMQAEIDAEELALYDGSVIVTLETDRGSGDIAVPPMGRWRSMARAALFSRSDDYTWAALTLSPRDALMWKTLDPTKDEADLFFMAWGEATGENLAQQPAPNRKSRRTQRR